MNGVAAIAPPGMGSPVPRVATEAKRGGGASRLFDWPIVALLIIAAGWLLGRIAGPSVAQLTWTLGLGACALPMAIETFRDARRGRFATDIVATLAVVGAFLLGAPLAGLVVVIMKRGGDDLERFAEGRASGAVRALEEAAPQRAHRVAGEDILDVDATDIGVDDVLLVRPGELVPCDGVVVDGLSDLDTSSLTGEPIPVPAVPGTRVMSGSANGAGAIRVRVIARAEESQYARIVELVRSAQSHKAPLQRMADRYAIWFTPITLLACAATYAFSSDWTRVLAVLVVATPCPLLLATPVAFIGGINRAAKAHIIVRNGGALEALSRVTAVVLDKTGTITLGEPRLARVRTIDGVDPDETLRLVAGVEQGSSHRLGRIVVAAAEARGIRLPRMESLREQPGQGASGTVEGRVVHVGSRRYVTAFCAHDDAGVAGLTREEAILRSYVAVDNRMIATLEFAEELRADLPELLAKLRASKVRRVVLVSGDHTANVIALGARAGIRDVRGDQLPSDKVRVVEELMRAGEKVMMVGDGTNDAPALTQASIGVALAGHGGGITAEAADVIVLRDSLAAVGEAMTIGAKTTRIAKQSIVVGLGLSAAAMAWAATGGIQPVAGAMLQEGIDIAVILNALRTIRR